MGKINNLETRDENGYKKSKVRDLNIAREMAQDLVDYMLEIYNRSKQTNTDFLMSQLLNDYKERTRSTIYAMWKSSCDRTNKTNIRKPIYYKEIPSQEAFEAHFLKLCKEDALSEEIIRNQFINGSSIGMIALKLGFLNIALECAKDEIARLQTDDFGYNLGMISALYSNTYNTHKITDICLDDEIACLQQGKHDKANVGILLSPYHKNEGLMIKALRNKKLRLQQNGFGQTMGMFMAFYRMKDATFEAIKYEDAKIIKDNQGDTIFDYAKHARTFKILPKNPIESLKNLLSKNNKDNEATK